MGKGKLKKSLRAEVGVEVDILVADSQNQQAIDNIVSQTTVLLSTAGPFAIYGNALVDACVRLRTHYVDITGETPWIKTLIDRYHTQAALDGTRIIPSCGFDSVPSDLGTYLVARYLQQELGLPCQSVNAYFQAAGGLNGGTLASGFHLYDSNQASQLNDVFRLNPPTAHLLTASKSRHQDPTTPFYAKDLKTWVCPLLISSSPKLSGSLPPLSSSVMVSKDSNCLALALLDLGEEISQETGISMVAIYIHCPRAAGITMGDADYL